MVKWTDSQQKAIDSREQNLLLSAAAGSGKTAVLVERILQLIIKDHIDMDRFLIVTFTNAAAGEMRERISKALYKAIEERIGEEQHLRKQIQLLDRAFICTLHSFCMDIVRKYFHFIDIDPIFRIGEHTETTLLKLEALEELFERKYQEEDAGFLNLIEMYGGNRDDQRVQNLVLNLYDFIQSKPQPFNWLEEKVGNFSIEEEFLKSLWYESLVEQLRIDLKGAKDFFLEAKNIALMPGGPNQYESILEDDIYQVENLLEGLKQGLYCFYERLKNVKHKKLKAVKEVDKDLKEMSKEHREQGKKILKDIKAKQLIKSPEEFVKELNELYFPMKSLAQLAIELGKGYRKKKQEKGILDFNDLEHYALEILEHKEVVKEYQEKFQYIFVDEYQDSNLIQETIVNCIKNENNVFLVGDVKQSIYRFRLADPSLFLEKYESYQEDEKEKDRRINLSKNFRSRKEIIDGVNFIFKHLMCKEFGEIDYDHRAALYLGKDSPEVEDAEIEFNIIEKQKHSLEIQEEVSLEETEEMGDMEIEAHFVAKRIKELLNQKIYDQKQERYRKVEYRDIVVLLRTTKGWAQIFSEVFISQDIPVYADVNTGYFEAIEVNVFMNLLKVIDNKRQDIPLLSVLRSPIFGLNTEELIQIRAESSKDSYFEAIEEYIEKKEDTLSQKLKEIFQKIDRWKDQSRYMMMEDFLWKLLIETHYYYYVGAMPGGLQRQANIRVLLDRAGQFQQTSMKGLFHFIQFVDQLKSTSGDMGAAKILGENENVVRIMSIHKSKGLEFPVVIVAGMGKQFNLQDTRQAVLFHKDLGLGPDYVDLNTRVYHESIAKIAMKNKIKNENLSEEMRVLYVALTRAKDKLILFGSQKNLQKSIKKWAQAMGPYQFSKGKSYLDWMGAILLRHPQAEILREQGEIPWGKEKLLKDPSKWKIQIFSAQEFLTTQKQYKERQEDLKKNLLYFKKSKRSFYKQEIDRRLNWQYPNPVASILPSKLSVTDVKRMKEKISIPLTANIPSMTTHPTFLEGKRELTGQERGSVTHFVLQHLDLNRVGSKKEIEEQIQQLVDKELIQQSQADEVDIQRILKYFQSSIGKRMLRASRVYREVPFNLVKQAREVLPNIEGVVSCKEEILIQGVIDCYFYEQTDLVLIDYKTDFYLNEIQKQEMIEKYKIQVQLYQEALEKIQGKEVKEAYLYLFHGNEAVLL
ncbi:helicase-exonuclease AddAB subunit AddA [Garciella nitratireducens]|uniref:ATP-dependent helicase/nuclease subunit A n=1 Tax=Garciella nitratireducens DSM 15102 TaxID=1121911 RepID=A0A1T4MAJ1_9FIRM|nr:helicase-exonuclease AddAB subunit AddA [Garciella nitratireducens]SJZ64060.1 DNA helicase/exodeoxyribonuclease V, subunit A [Garciella nitratireducens DSM 15102]